MFTNLRIVKVSLILLIFIVSSFSLSLFNDDSKIVDQASGALIQFHSYADLDYDTSPLEEPLAIDESITVKIKVKYWTDVPSAFRKGYPLNYFFLFGSPIAPTQKIHVEVPDPPSWANVYISSPDVYATNIPFDGEDAAEIETNLVLSPRVEAPAESYRIDIVCSSEAVGKISGFTYQESISFTPSFIPTIQINPENPVRTVSPHESVNFKVHVKNLGNKITRITPTLRLSEDVEDTWSPRINPPNYEIGPNEENTFTFSIIAPYDFGWHNKYGRFQIDFKAEVYPYRSGAANSTESIYLIANNYGFSLPGFEFITAFGALIAVGFIIKKKQKNRKKHD